MTTQSRPITLNYKQLYWRLLVYIRPYKTKIIIAIISMAALAISGPIFAALMKLLLDETLIARELEYVIVVPLLFLALSLFVGLSDYGSDFYTEAVSQEAIVIIRREMHAKLHVLPIPLIDEKTSGHLISKISYDVPQIARALSSAWIIIIRDSLSITGLMIYLFYVSWQISLIMLLIAPIVFFIIQTASKKIRRRSKKLQENMGGLTQALQEGIKGYREIRLYDAYEAENQRFDAVNQRIKENNTRIAQVTSLNYPIVQIVSTVSMVIMIYLALFLNFSKSLSVGDIVSYFVAVVLVFSPVRKLTQIAPELQRGLVASESIFELLDSEVETDKGQIQLERAKGNIEFRQVNFAFKYPSKQLLSNFNLTLKAGGMVAIVGESGSGKTTLTSLIARFYHPKQGDILLDGISTKDISLRSLRTQIALVGQQAVLFNDTVRANIAYGAQKTAGDEEIRQALEHANAWNFVEKLPSQLDEKIGESGIKLSGGQRQRLVLARAFLKDAPILILDEASSALDNQTENRVLNAINHLAKGRTTIVIAHRMSTIKNAPRILVMQQGEIVEEGNHETLLAKKGAYFNLYKIGELT